MVLTDADAGLDSRQLPGAGDETLQAAKSKLFLRLFLQNERRLYAYILTLLPNRADADDVLQEASLVMWDKFDAQQPPTDFAAWGCRIAYFKVLDFGKKRQRSRVQFSQAMLERLAETAIEQAASLQLDERREALDGCLEKLSGRDRDLLARRFADGATTQSTAAAVGRSADAVYKALARIRQALFDCVTRALGEGEIGMTRPFEELAELRTLLDALCEETITAEQVGHLEELVLTRPEAEAYYVQYLGLYADLSRRFAVLPATTEEVLRHRVQASEPDKDTKRQGDKETRPVPRRFPVSLSLHLLVSLSALAAGLLLVLGLWPHPHGPDTPSPQATEPTDNTVAVLLQAPGAQWEETGLPIRVGAPLPAGRLRLKSGLAHIQFYSGATVILEGPADLRLISPRAAFCTQGKLRALVPPQAQGFTIGTPKLELVDRGTEFGLQVDGGNKTEVHVFQGKVELYDPRASRRAEAHQELTTGQGVRLDGPGPLRAIKSDPDAFRTTQQLEALLAEEARRRHRAWQEASAAVRRDPGLVVHYTFEAEPERSRTLLDQGGAVQSHDGVIVGCQWAAGRWPGKKGLELKQVSDRVRFHVPGAFDSLTLLAWVRVDALPNGNNSLMMSDGWEPGGCHWQIGEDGKLILGVQQKPKGRGGHYHARGVFTPNRLGQWVQLAVVYDREGRRVTHYVDGQPAARLPLLFDIPLRIGNAEIGNWNIASHRNRSPIRYFSGCMDEFLLFARALSDDEIERLYLQGRPLP